MATSPLTAGWLYFIREQDYRSRELSPYVKIGIVRAQEAENFTRGVEERIKEHQTGNPRTLVSQAHIEAHMVEQVETLMHRNFAELRIEGEWFDFSAEGLLDRAIAMSQQFALEASEAAADLASAADLSKRASIAPALEATAESIAMRDRLLILKAAMKQFAAADKRIRQAVNDEIEREGHGQGVARQVERTIVKFDTEGFSEAYPEIVAEFTKQVTKISGNFTVVTSKEAGAKSALEEAATELWLAGAGAALKVLDAAEGGQATVVELNRAWLPVVAWHAATEWEATRLDAHLRASCGVAEGIAGVCNWKRTEKTVSKLDEKALRKAHEAKCAEFTTTETITAVEMMRRQEQGPETEGLADANE
jgi:hypothetical protein